MSELIIDIPVTPIKPVTPEITILKDPNLKRNSTEGMTSTSNRKEKVLPIYLRVSTSSCHDLCKYGKQHDFETKGRHLILKKFAKIAPSEDKSPMTKTVTLLEERKKQSVVKPKPSSPELKTLTQVPDNPKIIKREAEIITRRVSSSSKKIDVMHRIAVCKVSSPSKKIDVTPKFTVGKVSSPSKKIDVPKIAMGKVSLPPKKIAITAKGAVSSPKVSAPSTKIVVTPKTVVPSPKVSSPSNKIVAKPALSLKHKPVATRLSSSSSSAPGSLSSRRNSNTKGIDDIARTKTVEKKPLVSPRASLSHKPSVPRVSTLNTNNSKVLKPACSLKVQNKVRNVEPKQRKTEKLREKTLYIIELKPVNKSLLPSVNGSSSSQSSEEASSYSSLIKKRILVSPSFSSSISTQSSQSLYTDEEEENEYISARSKETGTISEDKEIDNGKISKVKNKKTKARRVSHDHKDSTMKQNFRRGKVFNLQAESYGARKLKFRQEKGLGDTRQNRKSELGKKSFRNKKVVDDGNDIKTESEKFVLRHQDMQGKKDEQVVINHVIEATARQLAETRKSKVKALVGAFESVISLHET